MQPSSLSSVRRGTPFQPASAPAELAQTFRAHLASIARVPIALRVVRPTEQPNGHSSSLTAQLSADLNGLHA